MSDMSLRHINQGDLRVRILHVSQPVDAGCPAVLLSYAAAQLAAGDEVHVACPGDPLGARASALGAHVHLWEAGRSPGPSVPGETRRLARLITEIAPDVLHLHSAKAGLAGRLAARGRVPTVFQPHAWSFDAVTGPVAAAALAWERAAARWTDRVVCVSDDEARLGVERGITATTTVVPNVVDPGPEPGPRAAARTALGLDDAPLVVCVGRLAHQKGQDRLLSAWPGVRRRVPDARLVLVGDGPLMAELADIARGLDDVHVVGPTADPRRWYEAADVVAVPSRWEGMALVPLEAQAAGRSVVATRATGLAESVPDGTGSIVPGDSPGALATALAERLVGDLADEEGAAGRALAVRRWEQAGGPPDLHRIYETLR
ncbi:glycosyltransferase [Alteromonas gracilis]